jgi:RNA-binding protein
MPLSPKQRKQLLAESHALRPAVTLAGDALTDAGVDHVRQAFNDRELIKVRVPTDDGKTCDQRAAQLADQVPCEIVKRVGRMVILYRSAAGPAGAPHVDAT